MKRYKIGKIIIPANTNPWPHEIRVAEILSRNGHTVIFLEETNIRTADILLDGIEFEIKSPVSSSSNSLEHLIKKALRQSSNIIIDTTRMRNYKLGALRSFLLKQLNSRKQIKRLILISKSGKIFDVSRKI